ncbi:MAG: chromate efflux transporter [Dongiaceae bacterium]
MNPATQASEPRATSTETGVSLGEAARLWLKVGCLGFGGPAGQIALMHRLVVDEKRWVGEERFLHALNYCMLLPGPEAQQLAIYLGWLLHRTAGGLIAGILFVLPGAIVMFGLSLAYVWSRQFELSAGVFLGLKAAVLAIVVEAVIRIGRRALKNRLMVGIAAAAFLAIFIFQVPFPLIVLSAGAIGAIGANRRPDLFTAAGHDGGAGKAGLIDRIIDGGGAAHTKPSSGHVWRTLLLWLPLWLAPVAVLVFLLGPDHLFSQIALFFSKMAVVTFGGAYAVLAYVAQEAVQGYGWLRPGEMLDGLALAETTPGPLILVLQFVGFLGAYHAPGALAPWFAGLIASLLTLWVTFAPCFLWIFLGAPYVERVRSNAMLSGALAAITAAVVGVILNLALWFSLHSIFSEVRPGELGVFSLPLPVLSSIDWLALALTAMALVATLRFKTGMIATLTAAALIGGLLQGLR